MKEEKLPSPALWSGNADRKGGPLLVTHRRQLCWNDRGEAWKEHFLAKSTDSLRFTCSMSHRRALGKLVQTLPAPPTLQLSLVSKPVWWPTVARVCMWIIFWKTACGKPKQISRESIKRKNSLERTLPLKTKIGKLRSPALEQKEETWYDLQHESPDEHKNIQKNNDLRG